MKVYQGPEAAETFRKYLKIISAESDRGAVLTAAALLDEGIERCLKKKLIPPGKKKDSLFDVGFAPLSSFSAKIALAFRLGLIAEETSQLLDAFRKLRNDFAHRYEFSSIEDQNVKDRIKSVVSNHREVYDAIYETMRSSLNEQTLDIDVDEYLKNPEISRAIFDIFFATEAMCLSRLHLEIEPIKNE